MEEGTDSSQAGKYRVDVGSAQGTVIGDHARVTNVFQTFAAAAPGISSHIRAREFAALIRERTAHFVGREFVFDALEAALHEPDFPSGYVVIRGEPGIGKTALMAEVVKRHGLVHHFNIAPQNIRSARDFLSNVCAQLIARYGLAHETVPPEATEDSGFLHALLEEASADERNRPLVIAVDALDEAEDLAPFRANRLYLPPALPAGVFIVVSSREGHDDRLLVDRRCDIFLRDEDPHNLRDVRAYVTAFLKQHRNRMSTALACWAVAEEEFVDVLTARSQGNFMYLVHVLHDVRDGRLGHDSLEDVRDLPRGLRAYYLRHWNDMKAQDPERFGGVQLPVVCLLATVTEPVSVEDLVEWSRLAPTDVLGVLRGWREFLNEERSERGETVYRLYHASFQDFLEAEEGLRQYHDLLARSALAKIDGF